MNPELAVIIPCLNEADVLPRLLHDLAAQRNIKLDIVVVDGNSSDDSIPAARAAGARIVKTERGRARQMNGGVSESTADWLLFLHADSRIENPSLLADAMRVLSERHKVLGHQRAAGHFALKFLRKDESNAMAWRYVEGKTRFNRPYCFNGDQGLLLSRRYFEELGGFDERQSFLEDQNIASRIRDSGLFVTLPGVLYTSARRFEQAGFHRQYLLMGLIMAMHAAGQVDFFRRAPGLYRAQHEAAGLKLMPVLRLARDCARESGRWSTWRRIGRFGCENGWQLFYFLDVAIRAQLGTGHYPCLGFYKRRVEPFTGNWLCNALATLVLWLHFHLIVLPWAWRQDR